jgi:hypothetical protein
MTRRASSGIPTTRDALANNDTADKIFQPGVAFVPGGVTIVYEHHPR